jgi:3-oxoacyl-[acyl-carrier-protein] synthase II
VVVTGIGAITPLGNTLTETWNNALAGKSGIGPITRFPAEQFDVRFAGEVKGFNPEPYINKKDQKKLDLFCQYAFVATFEAMQMAKLEITPEVSERAGTVIGVGMGGLPTIENQMQTFLEKGPGRITPFFVPLAITNMASGHVSIRWNLKGPSYTVTSACASGAHSIGESAEMIRRGVCDVMVTGGSESTVCPLGVGGFASMKALSTRNEDPTKASRPFDKDRDGFVLAEGAAVLVLEEYEFAKKRGANILCEITGYGTSSDAYHMTNPAPGGEGAARAIKAALRDAGLAPEDIDYVNAHGTSTPAGDGMETQAIKRVFGDHAKKLLVSSTKSMTGHTLGAAGAIESVFCIMSLVDQKVAPTINLDNPSEDCDLDYVPNVARTAKLRHVLNNSFGFGGTNGCLIFSRITD